MCKYFFTATSTLKNWKPSIKPHSSLSFNTAASIGLGERLSILQDVTWNTWTKQQSRLGESLWHCLSTCQWKRSQSALAVSGHLRFCCGRMLMLLDKVSFCSSGHSVDAPLIFDRTEWELLRIVCFCAWVFGPLYCVPVWDFIQVCKRLNVTSQKKKSILASAK